MMLLLLHFLLLITSSLLISSKAQDYLKLPLLHSTPFPTPQQALTFDSIRLSSLSHSPPSALSSPVVSGASTGAGQYFVDFHIGTPPQRLRLIADTGSDLVWVRCSACRNCSLHLPGSSFLPRHSSSFSPLHCFHPSCRLVPHPVPSPPCNLTPLHSPCRFRYSYADRSSSSGFFSRDTATLNATSGHQIRLPDLPFGCAFNVSAGPTLSAAHGVMGLGRGSISFPSQTGKRFGNKFSYCLMDYTLSPPPTSYLLIGDTHETLTKNPNLSFTPLQTNPLSPTFYYVRIESVSVDGARLPINASVWAIDSDGNGGTVIDSGTTLTFLPDPAYQQIVKAMVRRLPKEAIVVGPPEFDLCVNTTTSTKLRFPRLGFRLLGGAEMAAPARNYFVEAAEGVRCLALQAVRPATGFGVIGNLMQQGFLFVFDRDSSRLGFSRTGCGV